MRRPLPIVIGLWALLPSVGLAQVPTVAPDDRASPPPLVTVPDAPRAAPAGGPEEATPPPPGASRPMPGLQPQTGYPYSPYGTPYSVQAPAKPPVEVGLMVTESAFGMLTAAGTALIPYYLLVKPMMQPGAGMDPTVSILIFALIFTAVPLSVSSTELSLANGSRFYFCESWPASLSGLAAEAAVLGRYMVAGGYNSRDGVAEALLIVGSVGFVPLVEMAMINLAKEPRGQALHASNAAVSYSPGRGLTAGIPAIVPLSSRSGGSAFSGVAFSLASGRF